jgi:hypothetical protein
MFKLAYRLFEGWCNFLTSLDKRLFKKLLILKLFMRGLLFLLLVQFTIPAFVSYAAQNDNAALPEKTTNIKIEHRSLLLPVLLKGKEEKKNERNTKYNFTTLPILDFSNHSLALIESHQLKYIPGRCSQWNSHHSSLFALFCNYTI